MEGLALKKRDKPMDDVRGPDAHHAFYGGKPPARSKMKYTEARLASIVRFYAKHALKPEWAEAEWYLDPVKGVVIFRVLGPVEKPPEEAEKGGA